MFAVDCPLDDHAQACAPFSTAEITKRDRSKIGRDNTMTLFGLD
jgi:predicted TIM-barrel fold metal-dependent hydrolase